MIETVEAAGGDKRIDPAPLGGERMPLPAFVAETGNRQAVTVFGEIFKDVRNRDKARARHDVRRGIEGGQPGVDGVMQGSRDDA